MKLEEKKARVAIVAGRADKKGKLMENVDMENSD